MCLSNHSSHKGRYTREIFAKAKLSACIFELVYFSRPDSLIFSKSVYQFRKALGKVLAKEAPVEGADMVIPVPDSGMHAALGYAEAMGLPFEIAITRNHYVGRSFIQPSQELRESFARIKLNPIKNIINGKCIVIVDDSIVRGTTTKERVRSLREAGAKQVHMRISCPPIKYPCHFGIDFPDPRSLIANNMTIAAAKEYLNLDSLVYISLDGMLKATGGDLSYCHACYSGDYPIALKGMTGKKALE